MYAIKMRSDKELETTVHCTIYQGEKNSDALVFLVPREYNGYNIAECTMLLRYILPDGTGRSEKLDMYPLPYNDDYYKFQLSVDSRFTECPGDIELWLSALNFTDEIILKSGTTEVSVTGSKNIVNYLPPEDLDQLDRMAAQIDRLEKNKADNLLYDSEQMALQLTSNGDLIGDPVCIGEAVEGAIDKVIDDVVDEAVDKAVQDEVIYFDDAEKTEEDDEVIYF